MKFRFYLNVTYAELCEFITFAMGLRPSTCLIPVRYPDPVFPTYPRLADALAARIGHAPTESDSVGEDFYIWDRDRPAPAPEATKINDWIVHKHGSDLIEISVRHRPADDWFCCFQQDDWMTNEQGFYTNRTPERSECLKTIERAAASCWLREPGPERAYASKDALAIVLQRLEPPDWARALAERQSRRAPRQRRKRRERRSYRASFSLLKRLAGAEGRAKPEVTRRPLAEDEDLGPSLFRAMVGEEQLDHLTLPGLYVGRSEVHGCSLADSDLHLSTLNWSDFRNVDFSRCDLRDCDLRACEFENCRFDSADLSGADLRLSSFTGCTFTDAKLTGAALLHEQKAELALSMAQREEVLWTAASETPSGD